MAANAGKKLKRRRKGDIQSIVKTTKIHSHYLFNIDNNSFDKVDHVDYTQIGDIGIAKKTICKDYIIVEIPGASEILSLSLSDDNLLIYQKRKGVIISEPEVAALFDLKLLQEQGIPITAENVIKHLHEIKNEGGVLTLRF
jgi:hypothetical protein